MNRLTTCFIAVSLLLCQPALADDGNKSDHSDYGLSLGFSPFGGSLSFSYHASPKTSWLFGLGGLPGGLLELDLEINKQDYTVKANSTWVGVFLNHRPFSKADWFRLVAGIGIGKIENELEDKAGNRYSANYSENPVGYLGLGFGGATAKGFFWGLDIGWLQSSGPQIQKITVNQDPDESEEIGDHFMFGNVLPNLQLSLGWNF